MVDIQTSGELSPTVTKVLDEFISKIRTDKTLSDDAIARLEKLLLKGMVPKPNEINDAIFSDQEDK